MKFKKAAGYIWLISLAGIIIYFFSKAMISAWSELKAESYPFNYYFLLLALSINLVMLFVLGVFYFFLMRWTGINAPFLKVLKARMISELSSYVPGKVVNVLTRIYYLKGIATKSEVLATSAIESICLLLSSFIALLIMMFLSPEIFAKYRVWIIIAFVFCLLSIHPRVLYLFLGMITRFMGKERRTMQISYINMLKANLCYSFYWLFSGSLLFFIIKSIYPIEWSLFVYIILIYSVSWAVSFLSIIFPAGLGLREGILSVLMAQYMPLHIAIISSVVLRLLIILTQVVWTLISLKL